MERVEAVCKQLGRRVAILMDLQGPEVRISEVPEEYQTVKSGDTVRFCRPGGKGISLDHPSVFEIIHKGQTVYADDGFLEFVVTKATKDYAEAEVVEGGQIKPRKTVNFPGAHLDFAALVEKDLEQLTLAAKHHVDYVALSFVRQPEDIGILRSELAKLKVESKIIAKIEHPEAIAQFDLILAASDGVMVARGDLGVEYPLEEVPGLQKMIVRRAREEGKPVIVATQMLETMITNPRPTRAEVSDVANAVYEGTDAVMLSAESATGSYPVRTVKTMARIAERVGESNGTPEIDIDWITGGQTAAVVAAGYQLAEYDLKGPNTMAAFVVLTEHGTTAQFLSRLRPELPIIALTGSKKTLDQLQMVWGVQAYLYTYAKDDDVQVQKIMAFLSKEGVLAPGQRVIVMYGETWGTPGRTNVVRLQEVL
jgi:pyruvate kinase